MQVLLAAVAQVVERRFRKASPQVTNTNDINGIEQPPKKLGVLLGALDAKTDPRLANLAKAWPDHPKHYRKC
ncbi:MAG: hypothetical protein HKL95_08270 [Phycisphaerae bacterium]|nr:hypothetical protein [Phycisphaerae bacterium]